MAELVLDERAQLAERPVVLGDEEQGVVAEPARAPGRSDDPPAAGPRRFEADVARMVDKAVEKTAGNRRMTLAIALNYGGRTEIVRAARAAAAAGEIDEAAIERALDTNDLPPLDLLIRTSGEHRLSNFLLWQAAYAELLFVDTLRPDFDGDALRAALADYGRRERRYGGL